MVTLPPSASPAQLHSLDIRRVLEIAAPVEAAWAALLDELGPAGEMPGGIPFPMVLEPWPGGRWFRDLGQGAGHFWGQVQVIKPPRLLELAGPLFMSYPAVSHVQYRLTATEGGTRLELVHRAFGEIEEEHRAGVGEGWDFSLARVKQLAEGG